MESLVHHGFAVRLRMLAHCQIQMCCDVQFLGVLFRHHNGAKPVLLVFQEYIGELFGGTFAERHLPCRAPAQRLHA